MDLHLSYPNLWHEHQRGCSEIHQLRQGDGAVKIGHSRQEHSARRLVTIRIRWVELWEIGVSHRRIAGVTEASGEKGKQVLHAEVRVVR